MDFANFYVRVVLQILLQYFARLLTIATITTRQFCCHSNHHGQCTMKFTIVVCGLFLKLILKNKNNTCGGPTALKKVNQFTGWSTFWALVTMTTTIVTMMTNVPVSKMAVLGSACRSCYLSIYFVAVQCIYQMILITSASYCLLKGHFDKSV